MAKVGGILTVKGIDTSKPAEYIDEQSSPNTQNMTVNRSILRKRTGLTVLGATMSESVMRGVTFRRAATNHNVRIGISKIHHWNTGTLVWDDITGTDLTASNNNPVDIATPLLSGSRIIAFTNYINNIRKYTGTGNTTDLGGTPPKAKFIISYKGYLLLAYIDDGTVRPMRVQWSDTGDPETWSGGNAGAKDLNEEGDDITGLNVFGDYVCIHKENAIYVGYLVSTSSIFKFDRKSTGVGTLCNNSIQNLPVGVQAFAARDGIRLFNGISAPLIKSPILDDWREGLNPEYQHRIWSIIVPELAEYWVGVPIGSQVTGDTVFKYNYRTGIVYKDTRTNIMSAWNYQVDTSDTWDGDDEPWDSDTTAWDEVTLLKLFKNVLLGDINGLTLERNANIKNDNLAAVDAFYETIDFTAAKLSGNNQFLGFLVRWGVANIKCSMEIWAKGDSVTIAYSIDGGATWTDITTLSLDSDYPADDNPLRIYFDFVSSKARFRFRNNTLGEGFSLKQYFINATLRELRG